MKIQSRRSGVAAFAFAVLAVPLVAAAATSLSPDRAPRIDQFIEKTIAAGEITGGVTLVAINGRVVHLQARGFMDAEHAKPMKTDTIFRIASMSKPVAATALLMMLEDGKVRLDDPVSKFLPSYKNMMVAVPRPVRPGPPAPPPPAGQPAAPSFYTVPADREITVLDILTHTSGLMSGPNSNVGGQPSFNKRHEIGLKWVDNLGTESALEFQPGARWSYSPVAALDVAARIVEITSGKSFDAFLRERLFGPLGMKDTFFWPTDAQRARLVGSYSFANGKLTANPNADSMSSAVYFSGGGGLMSSAESYARFAMMLANGGELNGVRILSPATVKLMGSQIIPDTLPGRRAGEGYGLGVRHVNDHAARRTLVEDDSFGWSGAYGTHFWVDPKHKLAAILMVQTPGQGRTEEFETAVMQAVVE